CRKPPRARAGVLAWCGALGRPLPRTVSGLSSLAYVKKRPNLTSFFPNLQKSPGAAPPRSGLSCLAGGRFPATLPGQQLARGGLSQPPASRVVARPSCRSSPGPEVAAQEPVESAPEGQALVPPVGKPIIVLVGRDTLGHGPG